MEATLFAGWVYDHLLPHARELKVAHLLAVDKGGKPFEPRREPAQASERAV